MLNHLESSYRLKNIDCQINMFERNRVLGVLLDEVLSVLSLRFKIIGGFR